MPRYSSLSLTASLAFLRYAQYLILVRARGDSFYSYPCRTGPHYVPNYDTLRQQSSNAQTKKHKNIKHKKHKAHTQKTQNAHTKNTKYKTQKTNAFSYTYTDTQSNKQTHKQRHARVQTEGHSCTHSHARLHLYGTPGHARRHLMTKNDKICFTFSSSSFFFYSTSRTPLQRRRFLVCVARREYLTGDVRYCCSCEIFPTAARVGQHNFCFDPWVDACMHANPNTCFRDPNHTISIKIKKDGSASRTAVHRRLF